MKRLLLLLCVPLLVIPLILVGAQESPTLQITGVNATNLPTTIITATVTDASGRSVENLTAADFELSGAFAEVGQVVSVETTADESVSFAVVLAIDTSSSMAGFPLEAAQAAARQFVDSMGENDPVAIIAFNNEPTLAMNFTTDRDALKSAIDTLTFGGQTGLYEAVQLGVETAQSAPVDRRALVILSDGAQFGVVTPISADQPLEQAQINGVSIYTIGLGYGTDRPYLQRLANDTNAIYSESPTPDQLQEILTELAALFRNQYIITVQADVALDGTEYDLGLQATTPRGVTNIASASVRAPVPVPVVRLPTFDSALSEITVITPEVLADDGIATTTATLNGEALVVDDTAITIDPAALAPGAYTLEYTVTDASGDVTSAAADLEIAALPSVLTLALDPDSPVIEGITTLTVSGSGQTTLSDVTYTVGDVVIAPVDAAADFATTLNPFLIPSGEQTLTITGTNAGGAVSTLEVPLLVAPVQPTTAITGITDGAEITGDLTIDADATAQQGATITDSTLTVDGEAAALPFTLIPVEYAPGPLELVLTTTDSNGQTSTQTITVTIPNLGLQASADEISDVSSPTDLPITVTSQTPITSASAVINGETVELTPQGNVVPLVIDPETIGANGDYVAVVTISNESGDTTTLEIPFTVSGLATPTPLPSSTPASTPVATTTRQASTTATTVAANVSSATNTSAPTVVAAVASSTVVAPTAISTVRSSATPNTTATQNAASTVTQNAISTATQNALSTATQNVVSTATQISAQTATQNAISTATQISAQTATQDALSTATQNVVSTATQISAQTATQNAISTATQNAQITLTAITARSTTVARVVTATANAAATTTNQALATITANANATITQSARITVTANAAVTTTREAQANVAATTTGEAIAALTVTTDGDATESVLAPTLVMTAETTLEATDEASPTVEAAVNVTQTPVGSLQTGGDQTPPPQTDLLPYLICGGAALLLALLLFLLSRGRRE